MEFYADKCLSRIDLFQSQQIMVEICFDRAIHSNTSFFNADLNSK